MTLRSDARLPGPTTLGRFILDLALCLCTTLQQSVESAAAGQ